MNIQATVLIGSLIYVLLNLVKGLRSKDWNCVVTIIAGFVIGVVVVLLAATAGIANDIVINDVSLGTMDFGSKILVGLVATSLFSSFYDLKSAIDNTDSSKTNKLVTPPPPQE